MANAPESANQRWSAFINGNVILADVDSNPDVSHSSYTTGGVTMGADYRLNREWTVGALFGYTHTDASLDEEGSAATIDTYSPGIYAAYADRGWYANGLFNYGYNSYSENRNIYFPGVNRTAHGTPQGNQYSGDLDGGYEFHLGSWTIGPSAGLNYVHLDINSFSETGAGAAGLNIQQQTGDSLRSRLGFDTRWNTKFMSVAFTYHLSAHWQHEFMANSTGITSSLEIPETTSFLVQGTNPDRDSVLLDAGVDAQVLDSLDLFLDYQADAGQSNFFGQSIQAGVKVGF
jgi:outer membrane autotransporter protein